MMMINKHSIEEAYCFFHQKYRIYSRSDNPVQRDDIEYAIASYANDMNRDLYREIAGGKPDFLYDHATFSDDLSNAVDQLEKLL